MKYISIVFLLTMVHSCGPVIDDDTRAFLSTRVVDQNGVAVENAKVTTASYPIIERFATVHAKFSVEDPLFILGSGTTDSNGVVEFLTLLNGSTTFVNIESDNFETHTYEIANSFYRDDLDFSIPEIVLRPTADVNLEFVNTSGTIDSFQATIFYEGRFCSQFTNDGIQEAYNCERAGFITIDQNTVDNFIDVQVVYPSTLTLRYTDASGAMVVTDYVISNPSHDFIITY